MKKVNDWFFAGLVAGAIGGAGIFLLNAVLLLLGIKHGTYWQAMGGLFYNKELLKTGLAQVHGAIDALGVSAANGVLLSFTLVITGRDYLFSKSVALSAAGAYFLFLFVYPQTGLGKDSLIVPWVALFGHTVSNGLLTGYILNKIYSFKQFKLASSISSEHGISPVVIGGWKSEFLERASRVFKKGPSVEEQALVEKEEQIAELERKVGQLTIEVDCLKRKSGDLRD